MHLEKEVGERNFGVGLRKESIQGPWMTPKCISIDFFKPWNAHTLELDVKTRDEVKHG